MDGWTPLITEWFLEVRDQYLLTLVIILITSLLCRNCNKK